MADTQSKKVSGEEEKEILGPLEAVVEKPVDTEKAVTGTVNERLLQELAAEEEKEKFGARSGIGKKMGLDAFRSAKSEAEREAAIAEARDLNGVNPVFTVLGGICALAITVGLWLGTNILAEFFALHPVESDVYFVQRSAAVFRNLVVGFSSLAAGFFGVTGVGIFVLGIRVSYGVATGELDPTPIKKVNKKDMEMPNVWELMTTTTPNRRKKK